MIIRVLSRIAITIAVVSDTVLLGAIVACLVTGIVHLIGLQDFLLLGHRRQLFKELHSIYDS